MKFLFFVIFFCLSSFLHAQQMGKSSKGESIKLEICDVINLRVVSGKQTEMGDTLVREVSDEQLARIEDQLKRLNVCYWLQSRVDWREFCPKISKKLDKIYIFLVQDKSSARMTDGVEIPITRTKTRLVTGNMSELIGPPIMN